jgi:hypothetical protein
MFATYKEIVYGVLFGVLAGVLDTVMDAHAEGQSFLGEIGGHPAMLFYRLLFVLFGWLFGWLLWRNNKQERDVRRLREEVQHFHQEYEARAVVLHTNLQMLLTKNLQLPPDAETLIRSTYEKSRELQSLAKQRPSI